MGNIISHTLEDDMDIRMKRNDIVLRSGMQNCIEAGADKVPAQIKINRSASSGLIACDPLGNSLGSRAEVNILFFIISHLQLLKLLSANVTD